MLWYYLFVCLWKYWQHCTCGYNIQLRLLRHNDCMHNYIVNRDSWKPCTLAYSTIYKDWHISMFRLRSNYQESRDPITRYNPALCLFLSQTRTWLSNVICRDIFVFGVLEWELVVHCVNWWNCLLSLLKLSFHDKNVDQ